MPEQAELTCVSCDEPFDPEPSGGFCPNCDTPHPDYGVDEDEEADAVSTADDSEPEDDAGSTTSAGEADAAGDAPSFCPDCGADLSGDTGSDEAEGDVQACPDCGRSVTDESYCPDCGTDLDAVREREEDAESADEAADADDAAEAAADDEEESAAEADDAAASADADAADAEADAADAEADAADAGGADGEVVTLVVNGHRYAFGDGETFGRRDDGWLEDLVAEAGGSDDVAYVSSEHLEFQIEDSGAFVVDVSRNGTTLNGTDLDGGKAKLEDGDTLTLAERAELDVEL